MCKLFKNVMFLAGGAFWECRPQPSWDRSCTAAAAISLLYELHLVPKFSRHGLESQAEAMENALEALLEALTTRRLRMGRSISRKARRYNNICWLFIAFKHFWEDFVYLLLYISNLQICLAFSTDDDSWWHCVHEAIQDFMEYSKECCWLVPAKTQARTTINVLFL